MPGIKQKLHKAQAHIKNKLIISESQAVKGVKRLRHLKRSLVSNGAMIGNCSYAFHSSPNDCDSGKGEVTVIYISAGGNGGSEKGGSEKGGSEKGGSEKGGDISIRRTISLRGIKMNVNGKDIHFDVRESVSGKRGGRIRENVKFYSNIKPHDNPGLIALLEPFDETAKTIMRLRIAGGDYSFKCEMPLINNVYTLRYRKPVKKEIDAGIVPAIWVNDSGRVVKGYTFEVGSGCGSGSGYGSGCDGEVKHIKAYSFKAAVQKLK